SGDVPPEVLAKITKEIGADSLKYQSVKGLIDAIGIPAEGLCTACLTGKYPTPMGKKLYMKAWDDYNKGIKGRAYSCG
ncbi:TPA: amidophosphoribosyltransferase, partial [Candidatus Woesearchaeota archaeon]|nr:amidophosphoribosyltransferase [Candidatus Woesearchaeota archaeon]